MDRREPKSVLVTGASLGLGLAIARELIRSGEYRLILTARPSSMYRFDEAGIEESEQVHLRPLDVTNAHQRMAVVREAEERWAGVDVLINNAGISYRAVVEDVTEADRLAQMAVNFFAPMELARLVLPGMRARRFGRIINVSSVGGMMAMPTMAVYSASKWALEGASEALWYEVRPWGICVTLLQPGFINSSGFEKVRFTAKSHVGSRRTLAPYFAHYRYMSGFIAWMMRSVPATPEKVAGRVVKVIRHRDPPLRVPATFDAFLFSLIRRLVPRRIYHALLYRMLPGIREWGPNAPSLLPPGASPEVEPEDDGLQSGDQPPEPP